MYTSLTTYDEVILTERLEDTYRARHLWERLVIPASLSERVNRISMFIESMVTITEEMLIPTVFSRSVESVKRRGFYEEGSLPSSSRHALLMSQILRFNEEWGEVSRALRKDDISGIELELADAVVVLSQIAHLCGVDLQTMIPKKLMSDETRGIRHSGSEK